MWNDPERRIMSGWGWGLLIVTAILCAIGLGIFALIRWLS